MLVAVLLVGELPRAAVILLLVAEALDESGLEWVGLVGVVGWIWLAWAMYHEPLDKPGERVWEGNVVAVP